MPPPTIQHPLLNTFFNGVRHPASSADNEIWQFRGMKYGTIPARFIQSTLHESFPSETDATSYGPTCPQPLFSIRLEEALIGISSPVDPSTFDEFECLNLNITVPAGVKGGDDLPVMVYVHGGGGFSGSNQDWWCDGGSIVKRSVEIGRKVIAVAVNYRLSVFGYAASFDLGKMNGKDNTANFGPRDIQTALTFLTKTISPFGGNPSNITIYGESHGSVLIDALLHSNSPPLFQRAIMQSQNLDQLIFSVPLPLSSTSSIYESAKSALGVESLAEVPWKELLDAYMKSDPRNGIGCAVVKSKLWENFEGKEIMVGSTGNEGSVVKMALSGFPVSGTRPEIEAFSSALANILPPEKVKDIFTTYKINNSNAADKLLDLVEDVCWYSRQSIICSRAREVGIKTRQYSFEQRQAFGGPFKGRPTHSLDLAYLHGDPAIFDNCEEPEMERKMQRDLQDFWIKFASGDGEREEDGVSVFGPDGKVKCMSKKRFLVEWRRGDQWSVWEELGDKEMEGLLGLIAGHLTGLLGTG